MDELQERYSGALDAFGAKVHAIAEAQWANPTPCTEWHVHALVNHLVNENLWTPELFGGKTVAEVGDALDGDLLGDDPAGAWDRSAAVARAAVTADGAMERPVHLSYGDVPGAQYAGELFTDLVIHGWDLARGIDADDTIDLGWATYLYDELAPREDEMKGWGVFGDKIVPPENASTQTKLLAVLGRVG